MAEKKKVFELSDLLKILGVLVLFIPLMTAAVQYRQSVLQQQDEKFRSIVGELSSEDEAKRLAAASKTGIFIERGFYFFKDKYYDEAVDILVNRTSVELDYNVLNAIMGSLRKVKKSEYKRVIQELLNINRNLFIQEYAIENWDKDWRKIYGETTKKYFYERKTFLEERFKREKLQEKIGSTLLNNLEEEMKLNWNVAYKREKNFNELNMHKQAIADTISSLLGIFTKPTPYFFGILTKTPIKELEFCQNSLNSAILTYANLNKATFKLSALSSSTIIDTHFDGSTIIDTVFTRSDLTKSSFQGSVITASLFDQTTLKNVNFSGSKFKDVFFAGSDLIGADFTGVKGLEPIYFYAVEDEYIKKAKFDEQFKTKLGKELPKITEDDFKKYVENSELSKDRKEALFKYLKMKKG